MPKINFCIVLRDNEFCQVHLHGWRPPAICRNKKRAVIGCPKLQVYKNIRKWNNPRNKGLIYQKYKLLTYKIIYVSLQKYKPLVYNKLLRTVTYLRCELFTKTEIVSLQVSITNIANKIVHLTQINLLIYQQNINV